MDTPILFNFFNRPDYSIKVFDRIRAVCPRILFLAADGPRCSVPGDADLCLKTRSAVESLIDWPCQVHKLYRESNLGCCLAPSSAIDWFFSHVEEGIILEDDILVDLSFFSFAQVLLERYRNSPEVMHISGNNYQGGRIRGNGSYYASQFAHSWGWATWRRAWAHYKLDISGFKNDWDTLSAELGFSNDRKAWWFESLKTCGNGMSSIWDFQWHYAIMKQRGVCLLPQVHLVRNIGIGSDATHTHSHTNTTLTPCRSLKNIKHPADLRIHPEWDEFDFRHSVVNLPYPRLSLLEKVACLKYKLLNS